MTERTTTSTSTDTSVSTAWERLVQVAMLGTDRRDPPEPTGLVADLVDDTVRPAPSERMLAQVAATVAVRRAGVLPAPPLAPLAGPPADERPPCPPDAVDRWHHVTTSWPVLEDEWMLAAVSNGWRLAPELVPDVLARHRSDPVRRARAVAAAGPLADWLVDLCPELAARGDRSPRPDPGPEEWAQLPALPIPPDLQPLLTAPGSDVGRTLVRALDAGGLVHAHRAVLVNLLARIDSDGLADVADALDRIDAASLAFPLAASLADLARTRHLMLAELTAALR